MRANSILFVGLLSVAARPSVAIPFGDAFSAASGLVSRAAAYSFDIYQGFTLQQQLSSKNSTEVTYTTEGGRPYFQPYGAQRIGQDGPRKPYDPQTTFRGAELTLSIRCTQSFCRTRT